MVLRALSQGEGDEKHLEKRESELCWGHGETGSEAGRQDPKEKKIQDLSGVIENTLEIETSTPARIFIFIK